MDTASPDRPAPGPCFGGMLAIWHDIAPGHAAEVREWYAREHHFERLAIPGFREVRRFERVSGTGAEIFGVYRVDTTQVLHSPAYRARIDAPTEWTRSAMRSFRNMSRTVCGIVAQAGCAQGGHLAVLASAGGALRDPQATCMRLASLQGVLQVTALRADPAPGMDATAEQALRGGPDTRVAWALLLDADGPDAAEGALQATQEHTDCRGAVQFAVYRLSFAARTPD